MINTLLIIVSSQLWGLTISPDIHGSVDKYKLHNRKDFWKDMDFRRYNFGRNFYMAPQQQFIKASAPTKTTTGHYWNLTDNRCDYLRFRCQLYSTTGAVCARTMYYQYYTFDTYCIMEFHNCLAKTGNPWRIAYMGRCDDIIVDPALYVYMTYEQTSNYSKLTEMYVNFNDETDFAGFASTPSTLPTKKIVYNFTCTTINVTDANGTATNVTKSICSNVNETSTNETKTNNETETNNGTKTNNETETNNGTKTNNETELRLRNAAPKLLRFNRRRIRKGKGRRGRKRNAATMLNLRKTIN